MASDLLRDLDRATGIASAGTDLDVLTEAVDRLRGSDPSSLADTESIERLLREHARIEAIVTQAAAAFDVSGNWVADGARNAAAWLVARCWLPKPHAKRLIRRGRALRDLPVVAEAWSEGTINAAQVEWWPPCAGRPPRRRSPATRRCSSPRNYRAGPYANSATLPRGEDSSYQK